MEYSPVSQIRSEPVSGEAVSMRWFCQEGMDISFCPELAAEETGGKEDGGFVVVHRLPLPLAESAEWTSTNSPTHKQCTLVSVAFRFNLLLFGLPGNPYMIAQLTELVSDIWSRRS